MKTDYFKSLRKQFSYYKSVGEKTFAQLNDEQLFYSPHPESNSIAVIVNHLHGNMLSRWTDYLTSDGEKQWRQRDQEFEIPVENRATLLQKWENGWECLFKALDIAESLETLPVIYIRNEPHTIVDAFNRQLAHYPYHVGQIVFLGKLLIGDNWKSLSIPRNGSVKFNEEMNKIQETRQN